MFFKKKVKETVKEVVKGKYQLVVSFCRHDSISSGASDFLTKQKAEAKLKDLMQWMGKPKPATFTALDHQVGRTVMNMEDCWKIEIYPSEDSDREPTFNDIVF